MSEQEDVNAAFRLLRPVCVLVSQNHDVKSVSNLEKVLSQGTLSDYVLQEMHEYIAFPLRLILKQYAMRLVSSGFLKSMIPPLNSRRPESLICRFCFILHSSH